MTVLSARAQAKVNLTLRVLGRRAADGYHLLESLVCFADVGDDIALRPGGPLELRVNGPMAAAAGETQDNLVLRAARALERRVPSFAAGAFSLEKRLPVGAGLGGGSADAAAALRLLAQANGLAAGDARLYDAARETGSDVPVCIASRARWMGGTGHVLSPPVAMPRLHAVLANPGVPLATRDVYGALGAAAVSDDAAGGCFDPPALPQGQRAFVAFIERLPNDLEAPAIRLAPAVGSVLAALREQPACVLARMSGSGSTCFGVFATAGAAKLAARTLMIRNPGWWVRDAALGADPAA